MVPAMPLYVFPIHHLNPAEVSARPIQQVISGGVSIAGEEDVISTDGGGRWRVDYGGISLRTPFQQRVWSAWAGYLAGGAVECLVAILSLYSGPRPQAWDRPQRVTKLTWDDPMFPNSVAYARPTIVAKLLTGATLRATTLQIELTSAGKIEGGEKFSVGDYAYRIIRKTGTDTYLIEPPLREVVYTNQPVEFNWPLVKCRLVPGQDMEGAIRMGRFSDVSISFVESVPALVPA